MNEDDIASRIARRIIDDIEAKFHDDPDLTDSADDFGVQAFKDRINAENARRQERENETLQILRDIRDDVRAIRAQIAPGLNGIGVTRPEST